MDFASFKPCYKQKFFWVDGNLIAFEFGEDRIGSIYTDEVVVCIRARYVRYQTNAQGIRTGNFSYRGSQAIDREKGQRLYDLADEGGAVEWWEQGKKREQMTDPYGLTKTGQNVKRRLLSVKGHLRRWWRAKRSVSK